MFLAPYIKELLFTYECVVIPGMGAFVTRYMPASVQAAQTFMPPSKVIGFNPDLRDDDGLLVSHLCRRLGEREEAVRKLLSKEIRSIRETLEHGRPYALEEIGVFSRDGAGQLVFSANQEINFLLDAYGLGPFKFPELEAPSASFFRNPVIFRQTPSRRGSETLPGTQGQEQGQRLSPVVLLLTVLVMAGISLLPFNARVSDALFRHPASMGPLPALRVLEPAVSGVEEASREVIVNPPAPKLYPVIAGSFEHQAHAVDLRDQLVSEGYESRIMPSDQGFYRVVLRDYTDLSLAEAELIDLQRRFPRLSLWVLK